MTSYQGIINHDMRNIFIAIDASTEGIFRYIEVHFEVRFEVHFEVRFKTVKETPPPPPPVVSSSFTFISV